MGIVELGIVLGISGFQIPSLYFTCLKAEKGNTYGLNFTDDITHFELMTIRKGEKRALFLGYLKLKTSEDI